MKQISVFVLLFLLILLGVRPSESSPFEAFNDTVNAINEGITEVKTQIRIAGERIDEAKEDFKQRIQDNIDAVDAKVDAALATAEAKVVAGGTYLLILVVSGIASTIGIFALAEFGKCWYGRRQRIKKYLERAKKLKERQKRRAEKKSRDKATQ